MPCKCQPQCIDLGAGSRQSRRCNKDARVLSSNTRSSSKQTYNPQLEAVMKMVRCCTWRSLVSSLQNFAELCLLMACLSLFSADAHANTLKVNCGTKYA